MSRPSEREVAGRLLALKQVVAFANTAPPREMLRYCLANEVWKSENSSQRTWSNARNFWSLETSPVIAYLSPWKRALAETTALTMHDQDRTDAVWRVESARVLMWAVDTFPDLPAPDTKTYMEILKSPAVSPAAEFLASPVRLRPEAEIDRALEVAESLALAKPHGGTSP